MVDRLGKLVEDRIYNQSDMNRSLVLTRRDEAVAKRITEFLRATDRMAKTIVFCEDTRCISLRSVAASLRTGVTGQKSREVAIASEILRVSFANVGPRPSQSSVLFAIADRTR